MAWKKLLDSSEIIAYERSAANKIIRIEARNRKNAWLVYKSITDKSQDFATGHVCEYIAKTIQEANRLIEDLKAEDDSKIMPAANRVSPIRLKIKRVFKEELFEKWQIQVDNFNEDNYVIVKYEDEIKFDLIVHERYNLVEKELVTAIINSLGLKGLAERIRYDIFYYRKHTAKRRVYKREQKGIVYAKVEFGLEDSNNEDI